MLILSVAAQFQVLTDSREQYGLCDTRQYHLLHRGKPIDLSVPFRLTGISNNASVELVEMEGSMDVQQVRVCIQLCDGKRVQATFGNDTTIEWMLTFLELLPASEQVAYNDLVRRAAVANTNQPMCDSSFLDSCGAKSITMLSQQLH